MTACGVDVCLRTRRDGGTVRDVLDGPNVKGVTLWGYVEGATRLPNTGLMSESAVMRPAMSWLLGYLGR